MVWWKCLVTLQSVVRGSLLQTDAALAPSLCIIVPPTPPQQEGGSSSSSAHLLLRHLVGTGPYLSLQEPVHSTSPQGFLMRTSLVGVPRYTTCRQVRQHRQPGCVSNRPAGLWIHGSSWFVLLANVQLDLGTGLRSSYSRVGLVKGCIDDDYDGVICNKLSPTGD